MKEHRLSDTDGAQALPRGLYDPRFEHDSCGVGFVAHIQGKRSHQIVEDANTVLINMDHRGARGSEENTGDGAGMLTALPQEFLCRVVEREIGERLPLPSEFGVGMVFMPTKDAERAHCRRVVERVVKDQGQRLIGWRSVPTDADGADIGPAARRAEPVVEQLFIAAAPGLTGNAFERELYLIRKQCTRRVRDDTSLEQAAFFYICSLSTQVIIYKGMLRPAQLLCYFPDLADPTFTTHLAMVHSRFSTNTFPSWDRAQPNRFMAHNGEINTLLGNVNWMRAREGVMSSPFFKEQLSLVFPVVEPHGSDSGNFDNVLEFLLMTGRTLQESIMMLVPEAWQKHTEMDPARRAFYEYYSCLMEPWDGPASIAFTDGRYIGAVLDRNGLRPSRYYLTTDNRVIMASEVGVLPVAPEMVKEKGRLQPGRMFLIDFEQGRMIPDEELKQQFSSRHPYAKWLDRHRIDLTELVPKASVPPDHKETLLARMRTFGYTVETLQFMLLPLVQEKRDPIGSMGNDSTLACLSDQPRLIYDYFKQLFAQVTNPAIDSIREDLIMSLECYIGPEKNLLCPTEEHCRRLKVTNPILLNEELIAIREMKQAGWQATTLDITFQQDEGESGLVTTLHRICREAEAAVDAGAGTLLLSDRKTSSQRVPVSALMACGTVHHHLVRTAKRTRVAIIIESAECRDVHHHCLLIGFGADGINPYLVYEVLRHALHDDLLDAMEFDHRSVIDAYRASVAKGILKVMGKMGISTLQSYKGGQIFEALGLHDEVIDLCFHMTPSRLQGVGFEVLAQELLRRHTLGFPNDEVGNEGGLHNPGEFHWRAGGERHGWSPHVIADLQTAARTNSTETYQQFSAAVNEEARKRHTLRGLFELRPERNGGPIDIEEVESASAIVRRFCTGAMSFGSISSEAHETLAIAMNRMGGRSNTGEGGEDSERFMPLPNGDSRRSAIKQVASGRFGVTAWYLTNANELQIKIAQGAKPGEGGELPGSKVDGTISRIRYSTPGVGLISPPPHHDIYSIEDLAQLIYDLKNANPSARVSVKLVAEVGVGTIAAGVVKAHADHILISGDSGGTGASPLTSIKHAGLPWELGIAETHQTLVMNDLRSRVVLQTDGGMKTGRDVVVGALLGAEEIGFSTAPLIALGCIMMRKCHLNTCPVGIATQDPELRAKFSGQPEDVVNYLFLVAEDTRSLMAELGFRTFDEMVGRADVLESSTAIKHWKADGIDLSPLLLPAAELNGTAIQQCQIKQDHGLQHSLDQVVLLERCRPALDQGEKVCLDLSIKNTNRAVGTMLGHEIMKRWGEAGLPDNTIHLRFQGSAGQSFCAWLPAGVTAVLEGDANDYVGKGLSGGRIVTYPPNNSTFLAQDNILVGNVVLYGATGGQAFFRGRAAERFCIRNSGASAVVEGVGDHGCEYMTGGRVVILGPTGRNFAAGMSGGIAYVWAPEPDVFRSRCNLGMVELERVHDCEDIAELATLLSLHARYTDSSVALNLIEQGEEILCNEFVKVMPVDYKHALAKQAAGSRQ